MKNFYTCENLKKFRDALGAELEKIDAGDVGRVSVSNSNSKMGAVASVSLLPFLTCPGSCAGTCGAACYAAKIALLRPSVLRAYAKNTALAMRRPELFWIDVERAIMSVRFFRFHVSGDILDAGYFSRLAEISGRNPGTEVLLFTKKYGIVNDYITAGGSLPKNLHVIFSAWEGLEPVNPYALPVSQVVFPGKDPEDGWKVCGGNCFECACRGVGCWTLQRGETVCFRLH